MKANAKGSNSSAGTHRFALAPALALLLLSAFFLYRPPSDVPHRSNGYAASTRLIVTATSTGNTSSPTTTVQAGRNNSSLIRRRPARPPPACDLSEGEWVRDPNAPYYTNATCWAIQEHQNCMKYGRPDLDFLKWRWKPDGCELPPFDPLLFLETMRGKSLAFVGDSLARNQMQSLTCLLSRVAYPEDISGTSDENSRRMFYPYHDVTVSSFWSPFLVRAEEGRLEGFDWSGLWNIYLDEPDESWISSIPAFDYVVMSGGNWFTRPSVYFENRTVVGSNYFLRGNITALTMHHGHRKAFRTALSAVVRAEGYRGTTILRGVSPSHFENGEWNTGGDCKRARPAGRNETTVVPTDAKLREDQMSEFSRARREGRRRGLKFGMLDVTRPMSLRPDGHPSRYGHWPSSNASAATHNDCVHWCLPGPVDMWNDLLFHAMMFRF